MVSKKERIILSGNGNKLHGGLRKHAERIGLVRTPREDPRNLTSRDEISSIIIEEDKKENEEAGLFCE